jgi:hypothetical protein
VKLVNLIRATPDLAAKKTAGKLDPLLAEMRSTVGQIISHLQKYPQPGAG